MEKRKYNEDSTPEEIELMRARVYMLENSVIYMDEAPVVSPFQIEVMYRKVNELVKPNQENYFLINLVDTKPPKPADRAKLRELMKISAPDIIHTAVYTEKNKIINLVAKFVLGGAGFQNYSIHKTREEAIKAIENAKNK